MTKLIKIVVVVAILYFAVTQGIPWLKGQLDRMSSSSIGASDQAICLDAADRAVDDFTGRLRQFSSPPIDARAWRDTVSSTRDQIDAGHRQCRNCDHEACLETSKALEALESMVSSFDDSVSDGRGIPPDGVSRLDRVYNALNRARSIL